VIVVFYDHFEPVMRVLEQHGARPTMKIREIATQSVISQSRGLSEQFSQSQSLNL
jgi:hypothetical protein